MYSQGQCTVLQVLSLFMLSCLSYRIQLVFYGGGGN